MRAEARKLLAEGTVKVVIGYGERGPLLVTRPEDADRLVWNNGCTANLAMYLKRKEVKALGRPAIVVKAWMSARWWCWKRNRSSSARICTSSAWHAQAWSSRVAPTAR